MTTSRLLSTFRQANVTFLTLDPSAAYMTGYALDDVRSLLQGVTAFLPSEEELRALFWGRTDDLWQMAEALGSFGCEFIVVKRGAHGQMLYDSVSKKRWEIPAYPARLDDLTGAGDSFCGGFLAGYQKTFDPLRRRIIWKRLRLPDHRRQRSVPRPGCPARSGPGPAGGALRAGPAGISCRKCKL